MIGLYWEVIGALAGVFLGLLFIIVYLTLEQKRELESLGEPRRIVSAPTPEELARAIEDYVFDLELAERVSGILPVVAHGGVASIDPEGEAMQELERFAKDILAVTKAIKDGKLVPAPQLLELGISSVTVLLEEESGVTVAVTTALTRFARELMESDEVRRDILSSAGRHRAIVLQDGTRLGLRALEIGGRRAAIVAELIGESERAHLFLSRLSSKLKKLGDLTPDSFKRAVEAALLL